MPKPTPAVVAIKATSPVEGDRLKKYRKVYEILDFDGITTLTVDNARVVLIRQFASSDQRAVQLYLQVQHQNVVEVVEAFSSRNFHYIVMEEMTLCLYHLVRCPTYPSDGQLRSILVQASGGLQFLHDTNLGYGDLECKNMLLDREGNLKLTNQEKLKTLTPETEKRDTASLGEVALYLMQKDAGPGVRDPALWSDFLNFVASAPAVRNVAQLRKDLIFANVPPNHEESLVALIRLAEVASLRDYKIAEEPYFEL